jgi:uncharacterized membrane protein
MKWYLNVGFTVLVMVSTLLIRIPIPGGGYFNFGDVIIVFCGLYAGKKAAMIAGGIGSALADLIGFPIFAPITLIAKGLLGLFAGLAKDRSRALQYLYPAIGAVLMVLVYFVGTWMLPALGKAAALADLPANLLQAAFGYVGGRLLYAAFMKIEELR